MFVKATAARLGADCPLPRVLLTSTARARVCGRLVKASWPASLARLGSSHRLLLLLLLSIHEPALDCLSAQQ